MEKSLSKVALELHQWEMKALDQDILKALAPLCFNDLRTIFLVHDKRMLGIVLQELDSLVYRHNVLTLEEAEMLRNGIVPTIPSNNPKTPPTSSASTPPSKKKKS